MLLNKRKFNKKSTKNWHFYWLFLAKKTVKIDKKLYRILEVDKLEGDSKKAQKKLGWTPKTNFNELIKIMVESDVERWKQWKNGKFFPWDAINSIDEYKTISRIKH